ncbi:beta-lactamase [Penicillium angulare]|uniref:Beta-lactamase n=1 Tax=Penicillium angulare TaxID=116970 RepID=A0A9W9JT30_9EURO|nr:beta-lactamase [Penicillium angulare]
MAELHGSCHPAFNHVRELLQQKIADGSEVGASLCINIDGKNVLDLWGGYADASLSQSKPWGKDTITGIWSCTKVATILATYILVDRGLLDVNERVATYWPEFAANDEEKAAQKLAEQAPWFTLGSQPVYQMTNYGLLIGLSEKDESRTADTIPIPPETLPDTLGLDPTTDILLRTNGASGGFSNTRALISIASIISLNGTVDSTVDGKQFITPQTIDAMLKEQIRAPDPNLMGNARWSLGFALPASEGMLPYIPEEDGICYGSGYGGSMIIMDRRRRMTITYIMNKMEFRIVANSRFDVYFPEIWKAYDDYRKS